MGEEADQTACLLSPVNGKILFKKHTLYQNAFNWNKIASQVKYLYAIKHAINFD